MTRERVPYFQRPPAPHDWRWRVALVGRSLITLGLLMFAFVAYQLWGTGIQTAQAQHRLESQFDRALASTTTVAATTTTVPASSTTSPASTTSTSSTVPTAPAGPPPALGAPVARLRIAAIGLDYTVVEGVGVAELKKGPGHFPETPMPGQLGNAAIAGHRTTYGHPFYDLDKVKPGDEIQVDTLVGTYVYRVTGSRVVSPSQYAEVIPTVDPKVATLTLATCTPAYTARQRLIVFAELVVDKSSQVFAPAPRTPGNPSGLPGDGGTTDSTAPATTSPTTVPGTVPTTVPASAPATTVPDAAVGNASDAFASGWFDDPDAWPHVVFWGLLLVIVSVAAWRVGRRAGRLWVCFAVGALPFLAVLYFFFENINRLLPSSI